jgi:hypothetical protein
MNKAPFRSAVLFALLSAHRLAGAPRIVKAVRFGFVLDTMPMAVGHAGLLIAQ